MQDKPKRTFIAIKVIPDHLFLKKYNLIRNKLKHEDIRWVNPGNYHITLRFLGDTPEGEIVKIKEILDRVVSDIATFNFGIQGIDLFRSIRHPRVLWMGMNNTHALIELKNKIDEFLNPLFNLPPRQLCRLVDHEWPLELKDCGLIFADLSVDCPAVGYIAIDGSGHGKRVSVLLVRRARGRELGDILRTTRNREPNITQRKIPIFGSPWSVLRQGFVRERFDPQRLDGKLLNRGSEFELISFGHLPYAQECSVGLQLKIILALRTDCSFEKRPCAVPNLAALLGT